MKSKALSLILCPFVLLTACAQVPEEVREEVSEYRNGETVDDAAVQKLPFADALQQAQDFRQTNNTNISVESVILPDSTKMPVYRVNFDTSNAYAEFERLTVNEVLGNPEGGTVVDSHGESAENWRKNPEYCFTAFPAVDGRCYYRPENEVMISDWGTCYNQNMYATALGSLTVFSPAGDSQSLHKVVERFYADFEAADDEYPLCDGTRASAADVAAFSEDFCNEHLREGERDCFDYRVHYLDVREVEAGSYGYYVLLSRVDTYGNHFDGTPAYFYGSEAFADKNALIASPVGLWITGANAIEQLERLFAFDIQETESIEAIVTLESACRLLSDTLAQGRSYQFETAELQYAFEIVQSDYLDAARDYAGAPETQELPVVYQQHEKQYCCRICGKNYSFPDNTD